MPDTNGLLPCVVAISLCANLPRPPVSPLCIRRRNRGPRLGLLRCVGQALATEAIAEHPQWQCLGSRIRDNLSTKCSALLLRSSFAILAARARHLFSAAPMPAFSVASRPSNSSDIGRSDISEPPPCPLVVC